MKRNKTKTLRNKSDKLFQQVGRQLYNSCLVCGKPISCLHHYFPKSTCSALRYDIQNGIPICAGCHLQHHSGNPAIHNMINRIKGKKWLEELEAKKRNLFVKTNIAYYENVIKNFKKIIN